MSAQAAAAAPAAVKHEIIREAHGFKLEREQFVKEYDSTVLLYKHQRTGAPPPPPPRAAARRCAELTQRCAREQPPLAPAGPSRQRRPALHLPAAALAAHAPALAAPPPQAPSSSQCSTATRTRRSAWCCARPWTTPTASRTSWSTRCAAPPRSGAPGPSKPWPASGCAPRRRQRRVCDAPRPLLPLLPPPPQVLCGSRKYPIKEPFVELMKGSLNTFLNAFTYPGAPGCRQRRPAASAAGSAAGSATLLAAPLPQPARGSPGRPAGGAADARACRLPPAAAPARRPHLLPGRLHQHPGLLQPGGCLLGCCLPPQVRQRQEDL
jgi:hypothetical protein